MGENMRNICLHLRFDGSRYHGWQVQKNAVTVQQTVQDGIEKVFGDRLGLTGCSRTDAGVHANDYVCCFRTESRIDTTHIMRALNANLPDDIAVTACEDVPQDFHPRYSASGKEYIYRIHNARFKDPFTRAYTFHYPKPLDVQRLNETAQAFCGKHDFAAFCSIKAISRHRPDETEDTVRTIYLAEVTQNGDEVVYRVRGDGFLYNMVRIMVGTLLFSNGGKLTFEGLSDIIQSKDRLKAGPTAPAHGLFLNKVFYDETVLKT